MLCVPRPSNDPFWPHQKLLGLCRTVLVQPKKKNITTFGTQRTEAKELRRTTLLY